MAPAVLAKSGQCRADVDQPSLAGQRTMSVSMSKGLGHEHARQVPSFWPSLNTGVLSPPQWGTGVLDLVLPACGSQQPMHAQEGLVEQRPPLLV